MIKIKNLIKTYGNKTILEDVSVELSTGMNFIIGPSGSGKSTLLRMIAGIDKEYKGEIYLDNKDLNKLSYNELSYTFNSVVAMISQDFNIIQSKTVLENVLLPTYLKEQINVSTAKKMIKIFKLENQINKRVKDLSGGEKQRVAIIRELMKKPSIILADEPSSALDAKTRDIIMANLRKEAKNKTVIMITHDTSLIKSNETVYQIIDKKLQLINKEVVSSKTKIEWENMFKLRFNNLLKLSLINIRENLIKSVLSMFIICISSMLLFTGISSTTSNKIADPMSALKKVHGEQLLDMEIVSNYTSAISTGKQEDEPNAEVNQNIKGLYEKYAKDKRVKLIAYSQYFDEIVVNLEGASYNIANSGSIPVINSLLSGSWDLLKGSIVPISWVDKGPYDKDSIIGKEINFSGTVKGKKVNIKTKVIGVIDTKVKESMGGESFEYDIDDNFLFGVNDMKILAEQAGMDINSIPFIIRANDPESMLEIRDELFKNGIIPLGRFEIVEDTLKLGGIGSEQSKTMNTSFSILGLGITLFSFAIIAFLRRGEYIIYTLSGYTKAMLYKTTIMEHSIIALPILLVSLFMNGLKGVLATMIIFILATLITFPFIKTAKIKNLFDAGAR